MEICVTGCSRGLGLSLCECFLAAGHRVWGVARSEPKSAVLCAHADRGNFRFSLVDIAQAKDIEHWLKAMRREQFNPALVILNASIQREDMRIDGLNTDAMRDVIDVNLVGNFQCIAALLPAMLQSGAGRFVLIGSTAALRPSARSASYCASKAAMAMACRALALQYAKRGVRFATVTLGPIATDMWEGRRSTLVPSAETAAKAIARFSLSQSQHFSYPRLSTSLLRFSSLCPDWLFARVSAMVLKK